MTVMSWRAIGAHACKSAENNVMRFLYDDGMILAMRLGFRPSR